MSIEARGKYSTLSMKDIIRQQDKLDVIHPRPSWVDEVYDPYREGNEDLQLIPETIRRWGVDTMIRYWQAAPDDKAERNIRRKIKTHTPAVIRAGLEIARNTKTFNRKPFYFNMGQAATCLFLHDVARPAQFLTEGTYSDTKSWEHARVGAHMIDQADLPFAAYHISKERVLDAVADHSLRQPPYMDPYLLLTRDADKKVIYEEFLYEIQQKWATGALEKGTSISPNVIEALFNRENVKNKDLESDADEIVQKLGWWYDMRFPAARRMIVQEKIPQRLMAYLRECTEIPPRIEDLVQGWIAS